jgi:hypothetical protein
MDISMLMEDYETPDQAAQNPFRSIDQKIIGLFTNIPEKSYREELGLH